MTPEVADWIGDTVDWRLSDEELFRILHSPMDGAALFRCAAADDRVDVLEWLQENGCVIDVDGMCAWTIRWCHLGVMQWLIDRGFPFDPHACLTEAIMDAMLCDLGVLDGEQPVPPEFDWDGYVAHVYTPNRRSWVELGYMDDTPENNAIVAKFEVVFDWLKARLPRNNSGAQ